MPSWHLNVCTLLRLRLSNNINKSSPVGSPRPTETTTSRCKRRVNHSRWALGHDLSTESNILSAEDISRGKGVDASSRSTHPVPPESAPVPLWDFAPPPHTSIDAPAVGCSVHVIAHTVIKNRRSMSKWRPRQDQTAPPDRKVSSGRKPESVHNLEWSQPLKQPLLHSDFFVSGCVLSFNIVVLFRKIYALVGSELSS